MIVLSRMTKLFWKAKVPFESRSDAFVGQGPMIVTYDTKREIARRKLLAAVTGMTFVGFSCRDFLRLSTIQRSDSPIRLEPVLLTDCPVKKCKLRGQMPWRLCGAPDHSCCEAYEECPVSELQCLSDFCLK